ncbi:molybdopterin-guanine dinucleotide biosynthesis protein B [Candidatus Hecatella orcuttiae]|uniref:molybdopterin-guanine dinucleotide biosynthesis protein B n=1 Tax=Candidatus Hecatella orcuttiae TaxID=1935119 RepID=UPI002867D1C3|nr:molybdopterin-guanine dinucleotide biosynthesis protein B [Candidatus Hecatella orcuttiae]
MEAEKPKLIAVVGDSKAGKTHLAGFLIAHFTRKGLRVGSMKHIHDAQLTLDKPGKDTWRHVQAGAKVTVGVASREWVLFKREDTSQLSWEELLAPLRREKLDLVVVEGFRYALKDRSDVPKLLAAKNMEELKRAVEQLAPPLLAAVGKVAEAASSYRGLPVLELPKDGERLLALVERFLFPKPPG